MLVGERMSHPVISISPNLPIHDALSLFKKEHIRRAPVVKNGKLVGIVSDKDLLNASPSPVSSLSIWEMNYLLSKITIAEVMNKTVFTVDEDTPHAISSLGGNFIAFGQFAGEDPSNRMITFKVTGLKAKDVESAIQPLVESLIDIRE